MALRDFECVQQANIHLRVLLVRIAQQALDLIPPLQDLAQEGLYVVIAMQENILLSQQIQGASRVAVDTPQK